MPSEAHWWDTVCPSVVWPSPQFQRYSAIELPPEPAALAVKVCTELRNALSGPTIDATGGAKTRWTRVNVDEPDAFVAVIVTG